MSETFLAIPGLVCVIVIKPELEARISHWIWGTIVWSIGGR